MIGQTVSHYRIVQKLGEGGMGVVYLAEDTRLGRPVALKALSPAYARDPSRRQRFQQEARAAAALSHAGIAAVYELEEVGDDLYIVFEYVKGDNLRTVLTTSKLGLDALLDVAADLARAMAAAHAHGIVHRDLKPENIIRTSDGSTKILDFGLARFAPATLDSTTHADRLTDPGSMVGTVSYMSPEQLEGKEVDFRSDIFSFGVLLYELASGARPFEGGSAASTIANILGGEPVPLLQRNPAAPAELDRIARKCLRKRADERYQSTKDLAVDLENLKRDSGERPRPAAAALEEEEPSLLRQVFRIIGPSPRRWWEIHHIGSVFGFFPLFIWLAAKLQPAAPVFLLLLLCAAVSMTLRGYLVVTGAFNPRGLVEEIRRVRRVLHGATFAFMVTLALMGLATLRAETSLGWWALGLGISGAILSLLMEAPLDRFAFPQLSSAPAARAAPDERARFLRDCRLIAAIQLVYILPLILIKPVERLVVLQPGFEVVNAVFIVWATLCVLIGGYTAIALWRGDRDALRTFYRWFPLYLFLDVITAYIFFDLGLSVPLEIGGAILVAFFTQVPLIYLPFYQRRLAKRLLADIGTEEPVAPSRRFAERLRELTPQTWWTLTQAGGLVFYPLFLYLAWQAHQQAPGGFLRTSFLVMLGTGAVSWTIRVHLLNTALFNPPALAEQVGRVTWPLRLNSLAFSGTLVYLGWQLMDKAPAAGGLAAWLLGFGIGSFNIFLFADPAIDRFAFPQLSSAPSARAELPPGRSRVPGQVKQHLAAILLLQLLYHAPVFYLAAEATFGAGLEVRSLLPAALSLAGFAIFLGAGLSASLAVELLRGKQEGARLFVSWFPLFVLLDGLCLILYIWFGAKVEALKGIPLPVALTILATVFAVRFYERRLARTILGEAPLEEAAERKQGARAEVLPAFFLIVLIHLLYHVPVIVLAIASGLFLEVLSGAQAFWGILAAAFVAGAGVTGGVTLLVWRGRPAARELFERYFPAYIAVDILGAILVAGLAGILARRVVAGVLFLVVFLRFYQRWGAKKESAG